MTITTYYYNKYSPIIATSPSDTWKISVDVLVETDTVTIDASGIATDRIFIIGGTARSTDGPTAMRVGDASVANSNTSIRIEQTGLLESASNGVVTLGGGVHVNNMGSLETFSTGLDFRGNHNIIMNNDTTATMVSTHGSVIVTSGVFDDIVNQGTISAHDDAIVSTGRKVEITNNLHLVSTHGAGIVSKGVDATLTNTGTMTTRLDGIFSTGDGTIITNTGNVTSSRAEAIHSTGDKAVITNTGALDGKTTGLFSTGDDVIITNEKAISGNSYGVRLMGDDTILTSNLLIEGDTGIHVAGDSAVITIQNEVNGLGAKTAAIRITSTDETSVTIRNGSLHAESGVVLLAGNGEESILNTGALNGDVKLGGGNDWFSAMRGVVTGAVFGGEGDDVYVTGIALDIREKAGEGIDTVRSKYTWTLAANIENLELIGSGNMEAHGNALANILTGNQGDNHLAGGKGSDTFVFAGSFGRDIIDDYTDGRDRIDFSGYAGVSRYSDVASHMVQSGDNVVIRFDGHHQVTIEDAHKSDLSASDFIF